MCLLDRPLNPLREEFGKGTDLLLHARAVCQVPTTTIAAGNTRGRAHTLTVRITRGALTAPLASAPD